MLQHSAFIRGPDQDSPWIRRCTWLAILAICTATSSAGIATLAVEAAPGAAPSPAAQATDAPRLQSEERARAQPKDAEAAVAALMAHLKLGEGAVVADVGAGGGRYTWPFAAVVGSEGTVFAEEIGQGSVDKLKTQAAAKNLPQVRAVLGSETDPGLPADSVDVAFVHFVYHHFAKPREMLRGIRRVLKPGGFFVVVDRRRGTLQDWVPCEIRSKEHHWTAETTVVRQAREEGLEFVECAEDCWHEKDPFVLVFRRPTKQDPPAGDPDAFLPLPVDKTAELLIPAGQTYRRPVLIALGEGRRMVEPLLQATSGKAVEVVLEEWATRKDERPPLPDGVSLDAVLTENGDPRLGPEPVDAVYFLDSYHLLFHGKTLLAKLNEKLAPGGRVYVLDRQAKQPLSRREASHRRMIEPETVKEEMAAAGFRVLSEGPAPTSDRFLLVFGKAEREQQ